MLMRLRLCRLCRSGQEHKSSLLNLCFLNHSRLLLPVPIPVSVLVRQRFELSERLENVVDRVLRLGVLLNGAGCGPRVFLAGRPRERLLRDRVAGRVGRQVWVVEGGDRVVLVDLSGFFVGLWGLQVFGGGCEGVFGRGLLLHQIDSSISLRGHVWLQFVNQRLLKFENVQLGMRV